MLTDLADYKVNPMGFDCDLVGNHQVCRIGFTCPPKVIPAEDGAAVRQLRQGQS